MMIENCWFRECYELSVSVPVMEEGTSRTGVKVSNSARRFFQQWSPPRFEFGGEDCAVRLLLVVLRLSLGGARESNAISLSGPGASLAQLNQLIIQRKKSTITSSLRKAKVKQPQTAEKTEKRSIFLEPWFLTEKFLHKRFISKRQRHKRENEASFHFYDRRRSIKGHRTHLLEGRQPKVSQKFREIMKK